MGRKRSKADTKWKAIYPDVLLSQGGMKTVQKVNYTRIQETHPDIL